MNYDISIRPITGIKFIRIRPRQTWSELYQKYDLPSRRARWCNYFQSQSKYNVDYVRNIIDRKYIPKLLSEE